MLFRSRLVEALYSHLNAGGMGTIGEIFDAESPYRPRGCIAQAWSVAELLRVTALLREPAGPAAQRSVHAQAEAG